MVIIGKGHSVSDIWLGTSNQDTGIEDIILRSWSKKAIKRKEINPQQQYLPNCGPKEACYVS